MRWTALTLAALCGLCATPALSQPRWVEEYPAYGEPRYYRGDRGPSAYEGLPTGEIIVIVRSRGLRPVSQPMRRGDRYVVMAQDPYGRTQRVVIDADTGDIIRVVAARPHVDDPAFRERPTYEGDESRGPRPLPPLNRPRASLPDQPPRAAPERAAPERAAPRPAPQVAKPRPAQTAKASPDAPPMPRARPGDAPAAGKPDGKPARVILPGGPAPKEDRSAGRSYVPAQAPTAAPVETPPAAPVPEAPPPEAAPPAPTEAQPPAAAPAGQPDPAIPPALAF